MFELLATVRTADREDPPTVPTDLDSWEPGLFSHAMLTSIDRSRLSGRDLVTVLRAEAKLIAHLEALHAQTVSELAHIDPDDPDETARVDDVWEVASDELGAALRLTRRAAETRLDRALQLTKYPEVWEALAAGEIDAYRAQVICDGVAGLAPVAAQRVVADVTPLASDRTSGQLRALVRRRCLAIDPDAARRDYEERVDDRIVVTTANDDGTADLCGYQLPPDRVAEARSRIERIARSLKTADETRTLDQLRADVYLDLLCGTLSDDTTRGVVDITIDLPTLAELTDRPAELPGWGPLLADIARRIAHEPGRTWEFTVTHQGEPVWTGTTRRRPDTALARRVRARYRRCVFPGCRMPARTCDLDHRTPWCEGGTTCPHNLAPLCRHHHQLREHGWTYERLPDGSHRWTSPLGWTYTTRPPP